MIGIGCVGFPEASCGPVLGRDRRPPAARAHRPVPNPAKAITAKLGRAIPQPQRPDGDVMGHDRIVLPMVPEPTLTANQRAELGAALETQEGWDAYLAAIPCPDCEDGCCDWHGEATA